MMKIAATRNRAARVDYFVALYEASSTVVLPLAFVALIIPIPLAK